VVQTADALLLQHQLQVEHREHLGCHLWLFLDHSRGWAGAAHPLEVPSQLAIFVLLKRLCRVLRLLGRFGCLETRLFLYFLKQSFKVPYLDKLPPVGLDHGGLTSLGSQAVAALLTQAVMHDLAHLAVIACGVAWLVDVVVLL